MRRITVVLAVLATALVMTAPTAPAQPGAAAGVFPDSIPLPANFYPEGIAVGRGHQAFAGSLLDGRVWRGDLRTGDGEVINPGAEGRAVAGLSYDRRSGLLWGVGVDAMQGRAMAWDGRSGELVHAVTIAPAFPFDPAGVFLNDVVVTRRALYITDSLGDQLWTVPLSSRGAPAGPPSAIPLSGDFQLVTEPAPLPINLNGIDATRNGRWLVANHTTLGVLYRIDPATGEATEIDLGGDTVPSGDGILLHGRTLHVVQNFLNRVAVVRLGPGLGAGAVVDTITSDLFRVPTTVARFGGSLYLVNARFDEGFPPLLGGVVHDPPLDYDIVRVPAG